MHFVHAEHAPLKDLAHRDECGVRGQPAGGHVRDIDPEIPPPWIMFTDWPYGSFSEVSGVREISEFWRPFWDALSEPARRDYLDRYPPPGDWKTFIEHVRFDQKIAEIDATDLTSTELYPNGSPTESPERQPPANLLRRVFRKLGG